jgi:hypothetical protein
VAFLDSVTGEERGQVDTGEWIRFLTGPPLLAVTQATDANVSTLVRISPYGAIVGMRTVPEIWDVLIVGGVVAAESERGVVDPELDTMIGYDLDSLLPLWSEKSFTFNKQVIGGRLYLGDVFWSEGAKAVDPASGTVRALVPVRDPFKLGGSGEFDLQVVTTKWGGAWSPYFADCEELRRNDATTAKTMWKTEMPFHVFGTLRDDSRLFVAGGHDPKNRYVALLDWETGKLQRLWSGLPQISEMLRFDDTIIGFDLARELVAFRISDP